jgi:hypothetical protein
VYENGGGDGDDGEEGLLLVLEMWEEEREMR